MRSSILLLLPLLWFLSGCTDTGVTPGTGPVGPGVSGRFVLESFSISCVVASAPGSSTFEARLPYAIKYHFEGATGSVNHIGFLVVGDLGTDVYIEYLAPEAINKSLTYTGEFRGTAALAQKDSVEIRCTLAGAFWQLNGSGAVFQGAFENQVERKISIVRP